MDKKQYLNKYYQANKERLKKWHAEWYLKNRERLLAKNAEYVKANKDKINARRRARFKTHNNRKLNPLKVGARDRVYDAIRSGKLVRPPCLFCGNEKSQAHHEDYAKPLDVIWVCQRHHRELHKGILKLNTNH